MRQAGVPSIQSVNANDGFPVSSGKKIECGFCGEVLEPKTLPLSVTVPRIGIKESTFIGAKTDVPDIESQGRL